jgi:hypothetical protein
LCVFDARIYGGEAVTLDLLYEPSIIELVMCCNATSLLRRFELSDEKDATIKLLMPTTMPLRVILRRQQRSMANQP